MRSFAWLSFVLGSSILLMSLTLLIARQPAPQPPWIAYVSDQSGEFEIWRMRPDGSHPQRLTYDTFEDAYPEWSPDGSQLVFTSSSGIYNSSLYVMPAGGGTPRQITFMEGDELTPAWSPNGEWIAFASQSIDSRAIYLIQPDDPDSLRLVVTGYPALAPTWSPDGQWLVLENFNADDNLDLFRVRRDGSDFHPLFDFPNPKFAAEWSPDGEWLVFLMIQDEQSHSSDVYRIHPDGNGLQQLTDSPDTLEAYPTWSSDGQWLLYTRVSPGEADIFKMRPDGGQPTQITRTPAFEYYPAWSPIIDLPLHFGWLLAAAFGLMVAGQSPLVYGGRFRGGLRTHLYRKRD